MGMTIDEIIQGIEVIQAQAEWDYPLDWQIVLDGAIDIICKYQKIEQIRHRVKHTDLEPAKAYELINEVMEDGNE